MKRIFVLMILFVSCNELTPEEKLMGVDKNKNGIRDDVDEYILDVAKNNDERRGLEIYAKHMRNIFLTYKDKKVSNENTMKWLESSACLFDIMGYKRSKKIRSKIKFKYFNTKEQLKIFSIKSIHFSGQMTDVGLSAKENCKFDLEGTYEN